MRQGVHPTHPCVTHNCIYLLIDKLIYIKEIRSFRLLDVNILLLRIRFE